MTLFLRRRGAAMAFLALAITCLAGTYRVAAGRGEDGLKVGSLPVGKILFLGNSITLHGPAPEIGWTGDWGMAATSRDKDYVHRLLDRISKEAGGMPEAMIRNIADFERKLTDFNIGEAFKDELAFEADVVIVAIGENASVPTTDEARKRFADAVRDLLGQFSKHGQPRIFVRSQFWPDAEKDALLKKASADSGATFVDLGKLGSDPANAARSERKIEHEGVAGHPGDKGMDAIAEELWRAIKLAGGEKR